MATITYPLGTLIDDTGAPLSAPVVTLTGVLDKAGAPIANPGATVNLAGPNASVDYDAAAKGEAWITLAVSQAGRTVTGTNAAPVLYAALDSSRILTNLDAKVSLVPSDLLAALNSAVPNPITPGSLYDLINKIKARTDLLLSLPAGTVAANPTTTTLQATGALSALDNAYKNAYLFFTSGALAGLAPFPVLSYAGAARTFAFAAPGLVAAPAAGDTFVILGSKN